ncbi:MAG: efflux RND transporter periplasmic adaptor subunit, partial [Acidobacteriota bacterium]
NTLQRHKLNKLTAAAVAIACVALAAACGKDRGAAPSAQAGGRNRSVVTFPVEVAPVEVRLMVYSVGAVGSVDAFEKVQVTARVAGVVDRVMFAEGNQAAVNQVLVEIEPERYRLAVESAQASYEKAQASKADADAGLKRRETVITQTPGLIPGEEVETWRTKVRLAAADVAQTKAALDQAQLNLHDAYVRAPFSGILQTRTVQTGQYVEVGTVLATLVRRDPLLLRFQVPERDAAQMHPGIQATFKVRDDEQEYGARIVHVGAAADETTRMVAVTAEVHNANSAALRPGAFAEITVPVSTARQNPVVPQTAIRPSDRGFIAYVVQNDKAVERVLTIGMRTIDGQAEVLLGLKPGEMLVTRGAEALRDGAPVRIAKASEKAPQAPSGNRPTDR